MVYFFASQAKPSQHTLNIVLGFTTLYNSENAFFLRNQGKAFFVFIHILYQLFMTLNLNATKKFPGVGAYCNTPLRWQL